MVSLDHPAQHETMGWALLAPRRLGDDGCRGGIWIDGRGAGSSAAEVRVQVRLAGMVRQGLNRSAGSSVWQVLLVSTALEPLGRCACFCCLHSLGRCPIHSHE